MQEPSSYDEFFVGPWHAYKNMRPVTFEDNVTMNYMPVPSADRMNIFISTGHDRGTSVYGNRVAIICAENMSMAQSSLDQELKYIGCLGSTSHEYVLCKIPRNGAAFAKIVNIDEYPHRCSMDISYGYRKRPFGDLSIYNVFYSEFHGGERVSDVHKYAYMVAKDEDTARMLLDEVLKANNLPTYSSVPYTLNNLTASEVPRCVIMHKTRCKKPILIRD